MVPGGGVGCGVVRVGRRVVLVGRGAAPSLGIPVLVAVPYYLTQWLATSSIPFLGMAI